MGSRGHQGGRRTQFKHLSIPLLISIFHSSSLHLISIRRLGEQDGQPKPKATSPENVCQPTPRNTQKRPGTRNMISTCPTPILFVLRPPWRLGNLMTLSAIPKLLGKLNIFLFSVSLLFISIHLRFSFRFEPKTKNTSRRRQGPSPRDLSSKLH